MKITTDHPYLEYNAYLVINSENRTNVCLLHKYSNHRTTTSYARYIMSVHLNRLLDESEHVDHINGDKTDDRIINLQILTLADNNRKRFIEQGATRKMVTMKCPTCNCEFDKALNQSFIQKKGKFNTCSKKCLHEFLKKGLSISELVLVGQQQIIHHYRK